MHNMQTRAPVPLRSVLDAQRQMLIAQSELAASETVTATDLIAIYKALGGG